MTPITPSDDSTDELQFATAEPVNTGSPVGVQTCLGCKRPIGPIYFAIRDKVICPACREVLQKPPAGTPLGRLTKASLLGIGAGLVGALIWFVIRKAAHIEIGLVAVLVGFMVGKAVLKGSGGRGGRGYQIMAVVITYCCIAANYMPDVIQMLVQDVQQHHATTAPATARPHASAAKVALAVVVLVVLVFGVSLIAPFMAGMQNIIGLLIIGFALWEAWKFNRARVLPITGPYRLGAPGAPGVNV